MTKPKPKPETASSDRVRVYETPRLRLVVVERGYVAAGTYRVWSELQERA